MSGASTNICKILSLDDSFETQRSQTQTDEETYSFLSLQLCPIVNVYICTINGWNE